MVARGPSRMTLPTLRGGPSEGLRGSDDARGMTGTHLRAVSVALAVALCVIQAAVLVAAAVLLVRDEAFQHLLLLGAATSAVGTMIAAGIAWWSTASVAETTRSTSRLAVDTSVRAVVIGASVVTILFVVAAVPNVVDLHGVVTTTTVVDRLLLPVLGALAYGVISWLIGVGFLGPIAFVGIYPVVSIWVWLVRSLVRRGPGSPDNANADHD